MTNEAEISAALKTWRDGLVGLTRQSALIKFRAARTSSLLIEQPAPDEVLARLQSGKAQAFRGVVDPDNPEAPRSLPTGTFFATPRPDIEVGPVVRNLMRKANAEFLDRGLAVLYFAFGILDWKDLDGTEMVSPLVLVPVELIPEGPKGTPRVTVGEDDPVLNPALALRLKEFGIDLPTSEDIDGLTVSETIALIRSALERPKTFVGWTLRDATYLSTFSFAKEAMFKDLTDNEAQILEHPIVRALATSDPNAQTGDFQFEPIDPADIDRLAPPEVTPLVLDADSSQRTAVAASLTGKTFVMDGPPGTGKSQTIANMVGALLHAGKTVLFVSEKMAALDVVRNRLAAAGLGSYLLELHSHKASRKEVATELLRTLDNVTLPPAPMASLTRAGAKDRREQLNAYASAMNLMREPLNASLHDVLGKAARLSHVPVAPAPERAPKDLSERDFADTQETLARLVRNWRPAAQGNSFLWRDIEDDQSLEVRLYQAESALEELRGTLGLNAEVIDAFGLMRPSETPQIIDLIEHQQDQHAAGTIEHWLTVESTGGLHAARLDLEQHVAALKTAERDVIQAAGVSWTALPDIDAVPERPLAPALTPEALDFDGAPMEGLTTTADQFERQAKMLRERLGSLSSMAVNMGLGPVITFADAYRLCRLVDLRGSEASPDRQWFTPTGVAEARSAAGALREHARALDEAEGKATAVFNPDALTAPLADLQDRFANLHKGLKKMSGNYRTDKRTVASLMTDASDVKNGIKRLSDAIAWGEASKGFENVAHTKSAWLGGFWRGRETDFDALQRSFSVVDEVLLLTDYSVPAPLISYMTTPGPDFSYKAVVDDARTAFGDWVAGLQPAPAMSGRPDLHLGSIEDAAQWLESHVRPLRQAATRIQIVMGATGREHTLQQADQLLELARLAQRATTEMRLAEGTYRGFFGDHFNFGDTDLSALAGAIDWSTSLRNLAGGALTAGQIKALADSNPVDIAGPYDKWTQTRDRVINAFSASRHHELQTEFDDYRGAAALMSDLKADTVGQQEWFEYKSAYDTIAALGLDTAMEFCIEQRLAAHEVPDVVNRALLRSWSDHVIQTDGRLRPLLATDRDALIEEYRNLDRGLVQAATSDIITAVNTRRPVNTTIGESAVIRREGSKQKRHKPVRDLIAGSRNVTQAIKPVFMMSPLAVSQYLPSDIEFDVVIFDEASQVTPGDAINCIYRGKALILAGDDKQLPPTSFFERNTDDDDDDETDVKDFQSVLELAKAAGAFNNLGLSWHYRSRHEDLIGFSNYKFYEGKLVTFPSAHAEGKDVGVEFFHAHGMYKRGGGAYNPIEAATVAERVIEHFTTRPDLTLGVVTFSVAQADAVQNALDNARVARRDLDRFFDTEDRLDGFFIRALEQVQGDERDVIIFSVGYGPDEAGKISTNFGALNKDKGWRRLNVGITRARQRVEVVASIRAGEIPPSTNENVEYFRAYLDYADRGRQVLAVPYSSTGLDPESPFEESVLAAIQNWGYTVEPQVGAAGFRIDLGVRHPAYPGMFALGVECDGYQYHSAPAARDRDRLRDQILTGLGWRLHRIWGTAWYRDRATEETRLRAAIQEAIDAPMDDRTKKVPTIQRHVVETKEASWDATPTWAVPYQCAPTHRLPRWADPGEMGNHLHMVDAINALGELEGPIHLDIAYERLRDWWGIGRIGHNIRASIDLAIKRAHVIRDGDFLLAPDSAVSEVRMPTGSCSRKVEQVHADELGLAVIMLLRDVGGAARTEVIQNVARIFGWTRTGATVDRRMSEVLDRLVRDDRVVLGADGTLALVR